MTDKADIKKITASFIGDEAIELELLEKSLRLDKQFKTKSERDNHFISLALDALGKCIADCSMSLLTKYPSYNEVKQYLAHEQAKVAKE